MGEKKLFKAEPKFIKSTIYLKTITGVLQDVGEGYILKWNQILDTTTKITKVLDLLHRVIGEYSKCF